MQHENAFESNGAVDNEESFYSESALGDISTSTNIRFLVDTNVSILLNNL
jgi:hypothetical protein